jgi:hypothetical protein
MPEHEMSALGHTAPISALSSAGRDVYRNHVGLFWPHSECLTTFADVVDKASLVDVEIPSARTT